MSCVVFWSCYGAFILFWLRPEKYLYSTLLTLADPVERTVREKEKNVKRRRNKYNNFISFPFYFNIIYLSFKAVQWFTICGTSPPWGLAIGRSEIKVVASHSNQWSTLMVKTFRKWWTTALPLMTGIWFFS